jgi:hypothetical protein
MATMVKTLKLLRVTVPFMAIVLLAACGGAFWNPLSFFRRVYLGRRFQRCER